MTFFDIFGKNAVFPAETAVLDSEPSFGPTGTEFTPNYQAPLQTQVLDSVAYGPGGGLVGRVHLPDVSEVLNTAALGVDAGASGSVVLPSVSDVRLNVAFGPSSSLLGTLVVTGGLDADISAQLNRIEQSTSRLYVGQVQFNDPVSVGGVVTLYKGSDYKIAAGSALRIDFADTGGTVQARLTNPSQTSSIIFGAGRCSANEIVGTGSTVTHSGDITSVLIEIDSADIEAVEARDDYEYHVKGISPGGFESVAVSNRLIVKDERARA